jgi:hypothetical protein
LPLIVVQAASLTIQKQAGSAGSLFYDPSLKILQGI